MRERVKEGKKSAVLYGLCFSSIVKGITPLLGSEKIM